MSVRRGVVVAALLVVCAGCASAPGGGIGGSPDAGVSGGGGVRADGGSRGDGGAPLADGGSSEDGGNSLDGGVVADGGAPIADGGVADGGESDGGGSDGGALCQAVTVTPSALSGGFDCESVIPEAAVRTQVCSGRRVTDLLYNEDTGDRFVEWTTEGDGSGHVVLGCRESLTEARELLESGSILEFTGCTAETSDYYSLEATLPGETQKTYYRVNKCGPWPYLLDSPNSVAGGMGVGQVGPFGITVDADIVAHAAQYVWFVDRDFRPDVYLLGARSFATSPLSHALCEAERSGNVISVRKVTFTVDRLTRNITRAVEAKTTFPANCPTP